MGGKATRDTAARDRIKEQREAERRREHRKRIATIATVVVVAAGAVGAGWWYSAQQSTPETALADTAPVTVQSDGAVTMAASGVQKPVLDIYEDFQCPACEALERTSGTTIKNLAVEGKVKVVYHPITIFGSDPTKSNSVRAGAASRCAPPGQWLAYHDKLFAEQPNEAVEGFKVDDLAAWGKDVGITDPAFEQCVTSQKYAPAQQAYSNKILGSGVITQGTPTVVLDGKELGDAAFRPAELRQAVLDAAN